MIGADDLAWLDALRRRHYPAARNRLPAHLTLFHHLPPSIAGELRHRLADAVRGPAPRARVSGVMNLGQGTALRIESPGLEAIRAELGDSFFGLLVPQDQARWTPHVTIENKVAPEVARATQKQLPPELIGRAVAIKGLACWAYDMGAWAPISRHMFK
ncbi:2'-5' RNA ligase family protein [Sphingomonas sp. C3-2]|uniref:2'-5' RNA ligase family protein n=1 Tax=Sphingomonas sp. C3-2 TaxID=3062169 RepID=UPI00294AA96E|nr:2'-5' RNA ligase family protein [Sphingomonas sp. C3-2]WOK36812.1 2'-5' RNA ligase family protein [Sphingomonas sp. C3-2]